MHFRAILVFAVLQAVLLVLVPSVTLGQFKNKKNPDPNKSKKNAAPGGFLPKRPDAAAPGANSALPSEITQTPPAQVQPNVPNVLIEEDIDARPFVVRAGKLPDGLPSWFKTLADKNAQIPLLNWYRDGRNIDEFREWDRNNDGFITAEEALHRQREFTSLSSSGISTEQANDPSAVPARGPKKKGKTPPNLN